MTTPAPSVVFTFDLDGEEVWLADDPANARRPVVLSQGAYGLKVGLPSILDLLDRHGVPATFFVVGKVAEAHPAAIADVLAGGNEVAAHGYSHRPPTTLSAEERAEEIRRARRVLEEQGAEVAGYRAPAWEMTEDMLSMLAQNGFRYSSNWMDDIRPYVHADHGLVELPVHWVLDDAPHFWFSHEDWTKAISPTAPVATMWEQEIRGIVAMEGCAVLTLHPQIIGRPGRLPLLDAMLRFALSLPGAEVTTCRSVADSLTGHGAG